MLGRLTITKDGNTWSAELSDNHEWKSDDHELKSYLMQYHKPTTQWPCHNPARRALVQAAEGLEQRGYTVKIWESPDLIISDIIELNEKIRSFWCNAHGWAPKDAADLLARSRLDRQVSLSHCLRLWLDTLNDDDAEGRLILAWTNLGCLVEGTMKFFLSVYEADYSTTPVMRGKNQKRLDLDILSLEVLRNFFSKHVWTNSQRDEWVEWILTIQQRRNAIHAYKNREIGTFDEFFENLSKYLNFAQELEGQVPYP